MMMMMMMMLIMMMMMMMMMMGYLATSRPIENNGESFNSCLSFSLQDKIVLRYRTHGHVCAAEGSRGQRLGWGPRVVC